MTFLELQGLCKAYGPARALDGISLSLAAGRRAAIVGPSGCGKTTLLRLIAGFEAPDAGTIRLDGETLAEGATFVPAHRRSVGLVAQDGALFPHLSIADNIGFAIARHNPGRAARIGELADLVGLDPALLRRRPHQLSGGQQQRVALARALVRRPRLMLLDEPFSALDTGLRVATRQAVSDLLEAAGIAAILVTHDQSEALSFADEVAVMRAGTFAQIGTPGDLYLRPRDRMTAEFMGEAIILPAILTTHPEGAWATCAIGRVRVTVADGPPLHEAEIMLRPEQVSLVPADQGREGAPVFDVAGVGFFGATHEVRLIARDGGATPALILRRSFAEPPRPGDAVRLSVAGLGQILRS